MPGMQVLQRYSTCTKEFNRFTIEQFNAIQGTFQTRVGKESQLTTLWDLRPATVFSPSTFVRDLRDFDVSLVPCRRPTCLGTWHVALNATFDSSKGNSTSAFNTSTLFLYE